MKKQVYNPYLPLFEYIPDGEPHVFGDRVYIYGSHDKAGGQVYCEDHYCVWSAPVSDLKDWRKEGISYFRNQDPSNAEDDKQLWAPDVTQGPDGRYYLYYCFNFYPEIGVAVSDNPAGPFEFYGHVKYPENILGGKVLEEHMPFDPAVLTDDDGRVYLYYGFCPGGDKKMNAPDIPEEILDQIPAGFRRMLDRMLHDGFGKTAMVAELEPDMITLKEEPRPLIPNGDRTEGTGFEGHGFFEASSIRKIKGKYYFVYSSEKSAELCYAVSDYPDRDFVYGGILISNGDLGYKGRKTPVAPLGNNHGGLVEIGDDLYIFYHRQTNGSEFSRQGCAEKVKLNPDGSIDQVEITSCGLNGGPLVACGSYPAAIACHVTDPETPDWIDYQNPLMQKLTRITEENGEQFITAVKDGTVIGFKYFEFLDADLVSAEMRGTFNGTITVSFDEAGKDVIGVFETQINTDDWQMELIPVSARSGVHPLYFTFKGTGEAQLKRIGFLSM